MRPTTLQPLPRQNAAGSLSGASGPARQPGRGQQMGRCMCLSIPPTGSPTHPLSGSHMHPSCLLPKSRHQQGGGTEAGRVGRVGRAALRLGTRRGGGAAASRCRRQRCRQWMSTAETADCCSSRSGLGGLRYGCGQPSLLWQPSRREHWQRLGILLAARPSAALLRTNQAAIAGRASAGRAASRVRGC